MPMIGIMLVETGRKVNISLKKVGDVVLINSESEAFVSMLSPDTMLVP